jgi:hypothetical protein
MNIAVSLTRVIVPSILAYPKSHLPSGCFLQFHLTFHSIGSEVARFGTEMWLPIIILFCFVICEFLEIEN